MNKKLLLVLAITVFAFSLAVYQYVREFQSELADAAYTGKPAMGHSWSEMECTSDLCVKAGMGVGLGTDSPTNKLSVVGDIGATGNISTSGSISSTGNISTSGSIAATGDVCGAGACLSQIASYVGSQPLVMNVHNQAACTAAGGTITPSDVSFPMCKFSAASCPSGWTQYKSYAMSGPTTCSGGWHGVCYSSSQCTTASSGFVNGPTSSTCDYSYTSSIPVGDYSACATFPATCTSGTTQIGCY